MMQKLYDFGELLVYEVEYCDRLTMTVRVDLRTFNEGVARARCQALKNDGLTAAIATYFGINAFAGVVRGAADLETAMSRVQAATGATGQEMQALRKAAEDAGANTKFTSTEAAGALENLAKAGLSAQDSIAALPAVLNLAQAGDEIVSIDGDECSMSTRAKSSPAAFRSGSTAGSIAICSREDCPHRPGGSHNAAAPTPASEVAISAPRAAR